MHQGQHAVTTTPSGHDLVDNAGPAAAAAGVGGIAAPAAAANGQAPNQQMIMNAAGGQAMFDDDDEADRDWLDVSYLAIRFALLLMIVYFYSSMSRFLSVFALFAAIWM